MCIEDYGLSEWQVVLIRVKTNGLLWKTCVLVKAFWMVKKHVTFPGFYFLETSWKVPSNIHLFKVNNGDTSIMCQICSELTLKKLGRRYWPRSVIFVVVNFEHIPHIVLQFHCWLWRSKCQMRGVVLDICDKGEMISYRMFWNWIKIFGILDAFWF